MASWAAVVRSGSASSEGNAEWANGTRLGGGDPQALWLCNRPEGALGCKCNHVSETGGNPTANNLQSSALVMRDEWPWPVVSRRQVYFQPEIFERRRQL
jgi:hypothetical protein